MSGKSEHRINADIGPGASEIVDRVARERGIGKTAAMILLVKYGGFLTSTIRDGGRVFVERDGKTQEVIIL